MYEIFEKLCTRHSITPYRFCKETGINSSTISTWKKNNSMARPELAKKVCDYFNVSLDYLMGNNFIEDMGHIIREERLEHRITLADLSSESGISVEDLKSYENEDEAIREDILDDITLVLGTSYFELLDKYGLYDEYIPPQFDGDVTAYEKFKKAREKDVMMEKISPFMAKDDTERKLLMVCRKAGNASPEEKEAIIKNFESTIDMYLRAKGIKKE